ncbi:unnamed protein product, partial [Mesorhabditis belari]|uniref:Uncharacterized protein n=1 Tax=Mesorhabditis belari TaxID=2138241 RepID=A0AAF3F2M1_9BILA
MEKLKSLRSQMNIEPALIFAAMSMSFLLTSQPQFQYWARCIEIGQEKGFNDSMCERSEIPDDDEFNKEIQKDISEMRIYIQIANSLPNIISAPLLGIWADRSGRKIPLIFSICGFCIYALLYIVATLTYRHINVYIWFFISETIWGLSGGSCGLIGTMFAMIIDETRKTPNSGNLAVPFRIVLGAALQNFGGFAGNIVITMLSDLNSRYLICAILQCIFIFLTLSYVVLFSHETHHPNRIIETAYETGKVDSTSQNSKIPSFTSRYFSEIWTSIIEVLFRKRRGWVRFCIITSLGLSVVELIVLDINYIYLYIKRPHFDWSDRTFSLFMTLKGLCAATGMLLG